MITTACLCLLLAATPIAFAQDEGEDAPAVARDDKGVTWGPWFVLLPFDHPSGSTNVAKASPPEKELKAYKLGSSGPDMGRAWEAKEKRDVSWRLARATQPQGPDWDKLDFVALVPDVYPEKPAALSDNAVAFAYRTLETSRNLDLQVGFGSDDGCRIWLNGKLVHDRDVARAVNPQDDHVVLQLKAGVNHVLVKVNNGGGGWGCQLTGELFAKETEAPETPQAAINAAIDRGVIFLLRSQNLDGSWNYDLEGYRNGQTALSIYALLKSGLREDHPAVQRGIEFLRLHPPRKTYSAACQILALISTKSERHLDWIQALALELADWQQGGFAYPAGESDLSNSQYGALGLWAASTAGVKIPERAWLYLLRDALAHQNADGGFGYRVGVESGGSMTVAGLTIISICRAGFGEAGFPPQMRNKAEASMQDGLRWLADHFRSDKNPAPDTAAAERWKHYYLYGMERLAALERLDRIGEFDWYRQGSHFYVKSQGDEGDWGTAYGEQEPNTCFGLIFLSRGTASLTGVKNANRHDRLYATDGANADVVLRAKGDTPLDLWLSEFRPAIVEKYSRKGAGGTGIYVDKVEYLADGVTIATIASDARHPWNNDPLATQYKFTSRGPHTVQLRVHLAPDPEVANATAVVLASPVLNVRIDQILEKWMLDYTDDELSNLTLTERTTVKASSYLGDGHAPGKAADGWFSTAWICNPDDKAPSLTLEFRRAVLADRIVLSHATSREKNRGDFDRATRVSVQFGEKREPIEFDLDPNEEHKSVLMLPRKSKINEMTILVLAREAGVKNVGSVGFAEVELRLGDE